MGRDGWWDWRADGSSRDEERREMSENERRVAFEKLAEKCVIVDNLASHLTSQAVRTALGQFGTVRGVKMIINPLTMKFSGVAIAEMESKDQRDQVVRQLKEYLFMLGAMPRPARAIPATPLLLLDHPWRRNPNRTRPRLVGKNEPGADRLHERESRDRLKADDDDLLHLRLEEDEIKLAKAQETVCQEHMEKLNMIAKEQKAGTIRDVKKLYNMSAR